MNFYIFNSNSAEMTRFSSYIKLVFILILVFLLTIGSFNLVVDPYKLFGLFNINNFNHLKPEFHSHIRLAKANAIRQIKPDAIILGSSRAETGINPDHPGWHMSVKTPYNLALQSANINEVFQYLKHAQSIQPLKQVVIGLDFFMFNANKQNEADFSQDRLEPSNLLPFGWYKDIYQALFTLDGIISSYKTISSQQTGKSSEYFNNGLRDSSNQWNLIKKKGGHLKVAHNNELNSLRALDGFIFFSLYNTSNKEMSGLQTLRKILDFCHISKIDLHLFISPLHARKQEVIFQIGLWHEFENWKRQMVNTMTDHTSNFPLWDFTGFNKITTERFPELGDTETQMNWYWESSHYKKETGDLILQILFEYSQNSTSNIRPKNFGVQLSSQNIEKHLRLIRKQRLKFNSDYPDLKDSINEMITKTTPQRIKLYLIYPTMKPLSFFKNFDERNINQSNFQTQPL